MNPPETANSHDGDSPKRGGASSPLGLLWQAFLRLLFPRVCTCQGRVTIGDEAVATKVSLRGKRNGSLMLWSRGGITDKWPHWSGPQLTIASFFPLLHSCLNEPGIEVHTSESDLGAERSFWEVGPLGHPGDREYEVRPLKSLSVQVLQAPLGVAMRLRGETAEGHRVALERVDRSYPRPPAWSFEVEVHISEAELKRLGAKLRSS